MTTFYELMRDAVRQGRPLAIVTVLAGGPVGAKLALMQDGQTFGDLGDAGLTAQAVQAALPLLSQGETRTVNLTPDVTVFVESFVPPPTLFMVGGVHISIALAAMAKVVGFHTVVIDAREAFATGERFAHVDELIIAWPDEALAGRLDARSSVAVLTHDPKLDDPALRVALRSPARYIGALGSSKTHARRLERLAAEGFTPAELARIHGPIGLPIGAKTPEEIALSILAEVVKVARLGSRAEEGASSYATT
ncbi:XdhC family protein [Chloroflexus sp.]|uniref:XdhC family protein n=1 Tax=Chloroflexus sp. TaxID=1904827 RepID=UPI0026164A85|nr:XdhC/CoxI family protein [uncultured Chloroflexus sp.]